MRINMCKLNIVIEKVSIAPWANQIVVLPLNNLIALCVPIRIFESVSHNMFWFFKKY
jgi:hypothetical protein